MANMLALCMQECMLVYLILSSVMILILAACVAAAQFYGKHAMSVNQDTPDLSLRFEEFMMMFAGHGVTGMQLLCSLLWLQAPMRLAGEHPHTPCCMMPHTMQLTQHKVGFGSLLLEMMAKHMQNASCNAAQATYIWLGSLPSEIHASEIASCLLLAGLLTLWQCKYLGWVRLYLDTPLE